MPPSPSPRTRWSRSSPSPRTGSPPRWSAGPSASGSPGTTPSPPAPSSHFIAGRIDVTEYLALLRAVRLLHPVHAVPGGRSVGARSRSSRLRSELDRRRARGHRRAAGRGRPRSGWRPATTDRRTDTRAGRSSSPWRPPAGSNRVTVHFTRDGTIPDASFAVVPRPCPLRTAHRRNEVDLLHAVADGGDRRLPGVSTTGHRLRSHVRSHHRLGRDGVVDPIESARRLPRLRP